MGDHSIKVKVNKTRNWDSLHGPPGGNSLVADAGGTSMSVSVCSDEEGWLCGLQPAPL